MELTANKFKANASKALVDAQLREAGVWMSRR